MKDQLTLAQVVSSLKRIRSEHKDLAAKVEELEAILDRVVILLMAQEIKGQQPTGEFPLQ